MWINKIIYGLLTIYAAVLVYLYNGIQTFYIFLLLICYPIILKLLLLRMKRCLSFRLYCDNSVASIGQPLQCRLVIRNHYVLPVGSVKIQISYYNQYLNSYQTQIFSVGVPSNSKQNIHFTMNSIHTGTIKVELHKVRIYDYLRILSSRIKSNEECEIKVLPNMYELESMIVLPSQDFVESNLYSKTKSGDDPSEIFDIRDYKEGDKIHRIHWKLSTKQGNIMVKEYSLPISCNVNLVVDLNCKNSEDINEIMDAILSTIASISYQLVMQEFFHYITWLDYEREELQTYRIESLEELNEALEELLSMKLYEEQELLAEYYSQSLDYVQINRIYYITNRVDEIGIDLLREGSSNAQIETILIANKESLQPTEMVDLQYINPDEIQAGIEALVL